MFTPEAFTLNDAGNELGCPGGQTTRERTRNTNKTGWKYRFKPEQCADCPLRAKCMQNPEKTKSRHVIKNDCEKEYKAAREKAKTERYKEVRRQHPRIERKLGEMVRWHQMRYARYRGRAKVLIQALMTGLVVNVKRMVKLIRSQEMEVGTVRAVAANG